MNRFDGFHIWVSVAIKLDLVLIKGIGSNSHKYHIIMKEEELKNNAKQSTNSITRCLMPYTSLQSINIRKPCI
jgi:hypothetical protein